MPDAVGLHARGWALGAAEWVLAHPVPGEDANTDIFAIGFSLVLAAELLVSPSMIMGYNQILLIPAALILLKHSLTSLRRYWADGAGWIPAHQTSTAEHRD